MKVFAKIFSNQHWRNWSSFEKFSSVTIIIGLVIAGLSYVSSIELDVDPREELAKKGTQWSYDNFMQAISSNDIEGIKLFSQAGMRLKTDHFEAYMISHFNPEVGSIFKENNVVDSTACFSGPNNMDFYLKLKHDPFKWSYVKSLCAGPEFRDRLNETYSKEVDNYNQVVAKNNNRNTRINECMSDLNRFTTRQYYNDASKFVLTSKLTYTPREEVLANLNIELLTGSSKLNNPEKLLQESIRKVCIRINPKVQESREDIRKTKSVIEIFEQ